MLGRDKGRWGKIRKSEQMQDHNEVKWQSLENSRKLNRGYTVGNCLVLVSEDLHN